MKKAVVIVAVGSENSQGQAGLERFSARVAAAFPEAKVCIVFTSDRVRARLATKGIKADSVEEALTKLYAEDYSLVAVQPLYTLSGVEYEEISQFITGFSASMHCDYAKFKVCLGQPLLPLQANLNIADSNKNAKASSECQTTSFECADLQRIAKALFSAVPAEREQGEALLWMGHGSPHHADTAYTALAQALKELDKDSFVGTMDGSTNLDSLLPELLAKLNTAALKPKIWLTPLLSIIGRHALFDMAGDGEKSWKSRLIKQGFEVQIVLSGLTDNPDIAQMWVERIQDSFELMLKPE